MSICPLVTLTTAPRRGRRRRESRVLGSSKQFLAPRGARPQVYPSLLGPGAGFFFMATSCSCRDVSARHSRSSGPTSVRRSGADVARRPSLWLCALWRMELILNCYMLTIWNTDSHTDSRLDSVSGRATTSLLSCSCTPRLTDFHRLEHWRTVRAPRGAGDRLHNVWYQPYFNS